MGQNDEGFERIYILLCHTNWLTFRESYLTSLSLLPDFNQFLNSSAKNLGLNLSKTYWSYDQFFSTSSPNSVSAWSPDAWGTYLGWMKSASSYGMVFDPTLWVGICSQSLEAADCGPQLCHCVIHMSLESCSLDWPQESTGTEKIPPVAHSQQYAELSTRGQSWHDFLYNSVNSLEICKALWKILCFDSVHLLWAHKIACAGD